MNGGPRLHIGWHKLVMAWGWGVNAPDGRVLDIGYEETWAEALAVGLAALEQASVRMSA